MGAGLRCGFNGWRAFTLHALERGRRFGRGISIFNAELRAVRRALNTWRELALVYANLSSYILTIRYGVARRALAAWERCANIALPYILAYTFACTADKMFLRAHA